MPDNIVTPQKKEFRQSAAWLLAVLAGSVFLVEALVMLFLHMLPPMSEVVSTLLDASLLSLLLSPIFYFIVFRPLVLNIAERKQAEEVVRTSEERFRSIFDHSKVGMNVIGPDYKYMRVNSAFCEMTGYSEEELLAHDFKGITHPEDIEPNLVLSKKLLAGEIDFFHLEKRYIRKNGNLLWGDLTVSAVRDVSGKLTFGIAIIQDITERKRIELELQQAKAAADAASRAKGDFLANMSHEIRTPMNAIIGLSHLSLQTELSVKQRDYQQKIHGSAKSLLGIINDILDFSKIEAGKMEMESVAFKLEDVISNLATIIASKAEEKDLEFLLETSLDVPPDLIGDPMRLGQVLINLTGNAIKFTGKGEVLVLTEIEEESASHATLRFTIKDTGIGMTQEQVGKLFHAFTQADATTTRKFGGTGLGLSISKRLVEMMGGKIWAESMPGEGTEFIFTARFQKPAENPQKCFLPTPDLRGLRVLVIDDNRSSCRILKTHLESFTFNVATAVSGIEALQEIVTASEGGAPYNLVIIDWKKPRIEGIETARKIRGTAGLSKTPKVLLIAPSNQLKIRQDEKDNVADGLLAKPFQHSDLFNAIMEVFGHGEAAGKKIAPAALFHPDFVKKISGAHLLLVEDNEINQQVARELLEKAGVSVVIAENGEEAIVRIREEKFDGVLMDMQMPVMDGLTATREIRRNLRFADLPIIAMTASVLVSDQEQCRAAGMNDHIAKPFDPNRLVETLAKWVTPARPTTSPVKHALQRQEDMPDLPGIRVAEGVLRMGGNVASYYAILEKFCTGQQHVIAEIHSALAAGDREKAERLAHTLKGLSGTIGAEEMQNMTKGLEDGIRSGEISRAEQMLPTIDSELAALLATIGCALQLRQKKDAEAASTGSVNLEELADLIRSARLQFEKFDSSVEESVARINRMVRGDAAMKQTLDSIGSHISKYDYEQGLAELNDWAKRMEIK